MLRREDVATTLGHLIDLQHDVDHDGIETEEARRIAHAFTLTTVTVLDECT
jgi:hypothetical protein